MNKYSSQLIQSVGYNDNHTSLLNFALYDSCFWSATILKLDRKQKQIINTCPICFDDNNISLIPLTKDEVYHLPVRSKSG